MLPIPIPIPAITTNTEERKEELILLVSQNKSTILLFKQYQCYCHCLVKEALCFRFFEGRLLFVCSIPTHSAWPVLARGKGEMNIKNVALFFLQSACNEAFLKSRLFTFPEQQKTSFYTRSRSTMACCLFSSNTILEL